MIQSMAGILSGVKDLSVHNVVLRFGMSGTARHVSGNV